MEQVYLSKQIEQYRLTAGKRTVIVQSNRPLLRNRNLKHWKSEWKLIEGSLYFKGGFEITIRNLEEYLDALDEGKKIGSSKKS